MSRSTIAWGVAHSSYINLHGLTARGSKLVYGKLHSEYLRALDLAESPSVFFINAERGWKINRTHTRLLVANVCGTITPKEDVVVLCNSPMMIRLMHPFEAWALQGVSLPELVSSEVPERDFSNRDLINMAGNAFHSGSFCMFAFASLMTAANQMLHLCLFLLR